MAHLCDVNTLLAICYDRHAHHAAALEWLENTPGDIVLCRLSQMGLIRLLTNPAVMGDRAVRGSEAWKIIDTILSDSRFRFQAEPGGFDHQFRAYTTSLVFSPNAWTDAYFAAFARASGHTLVTFDGGFRSYPALRPLVLGPKAAKG